MRAAKSMGLRNLPSKTWVVNCGWVLAANLAADLAAWCRLLGLYDWEDLKDAEPDTLRYRLLSLPARLRPPRPRPRAEDQPHLALEGGIPGLLAAAVRPARTRLTSHPRPRDPERRPPRRSRSRCPRAHRAVRHRCEHVDQTQPPKTGITRSVTSLDPPLNR